MRIIDIYIDMRMLQNMKSQNMYTYWLPSGFFRQIHHIDPKNFHEARCEK